MEVHIKAPASSIWTHHSYELQGLVLDTPARHRGDEFCCCTVSSGYNVNYSLTCARQPTTFTCFKVPYGGNLDAHRGWRRIKCRSGVKYGDRAAAKERKQMNWSMASRRVCGSRSVSASVLHHGMRANRDEYLGALIAA